MPHSLADCQAKVARAREHLATLTQSVETFLARDPYDLVQHDDPATDEHVVAVRVREEPPSAHLATLVGDVAHNLRSALDYLSHQFVLANEGTPTRATEFPIFLDRNQYASDAPRKTRGMSPEAITLIEGLQPFASATPNRHVLWVLHELNNADKHRELSVVGSAVHSQGLTVTGNVQVRVRPAAPVSMGVPMPILILQDGTELVRLAIVNHGAGVQAKGSFGFGLSFESPAIVRGEPIVPLIRSLTDGVGGIVDSNEVRALVG